MPTYLIERNVGNITEADLDAAGHKSTEVLKGMPGVVWVRSYASLSEGKVFCEYNAPDEESIREHARRAGLPCDNIIEIGVELSPAMFR